MSEADLVIRGDVVTPDRVIADGYVAASAARPSRVLAKANNTPRRRYKIAAATGLFPASDGQTTMPPVS